MLYSSFRPLYLCTFASGKSCLTEIHRISQNLRPLPSHYLTLWGKLTSSLFLRYSYFNIEFTKKPSLPHSLRRIAGRGKRVWPWNKCGYTQIDSEIGISDYQRVNMIRPTSYWRLLKWSTDGYSSVQLMATPSAQLKAQKVFNRSLPRPTVEIKNSNYSPFVILRTNALSRVRPFRKNLCPGPLLAIIFNI